jgi:hypothetical protein
LPFFLLWCYFCLCTYTQMQHHNRARGNHLVSVPTGPCRTGARQGTYIATTPAKKIAAVASTTKTF